MHQPRLLDGVRVLDAASFIAGPVATTVMADFGATCEVLREAGFGEADIERLLRAG